MAAPSTGTAARRARGQLILAIAFGALTVIALAVPVWIEEISGLSPDDGRGELELLLAVPFGVASIVLGILTYRSRRAAARTTA